MSFISRTGLFERPICPECGSENTSTARLVKLGAGFGIGILLPVFLYVISFIYPSSSIIIPLLIIFGLLMSVTPCLRKYCCLNCDAYWNPDNPKLVWRPRTPGI